MLRVGRSGRVRALVLAFIIIAGGFTAIPGIRPLAGPLPPVVGSIGDLVWLDENVDGVRQLLEPGLAGVTVGLVTTTNICPACQAALEEAGATITGPRSAWWWAS